LVYPLLYRPLPRRALVFLVSVLLAAQAMAAPSDPNPESLAFRPHDPLTLTAFNHFYNLDYDRAVQEFQQILARHPDDPFAINHLSSATLFRELYRMGVLNTGEYANDTFISAPHRPADPKVTQQIRDLINRALEVEEKRLAANPNDVEALYARGVTRAQFATYTALIEHAWFSALRSAVGARRDHERVLELSPSTVEAKLIVGAHNYVVGNLPWGIKTTVSVFGLRGNKEKGLQYLKECAQGNGETSVDAQILLAVFLRREHRYDEALPIVRSLVPRFPGDVLLALEEGHLLRAKGQYQQAAQVYRKIWQTGRDGHYPGVHYEIAALSLGDLLRSQKDYSGAAAAYEQVGQAQEADSEALQKAYLGAGEMYDLLQKRDLALVKYQAVVARDGSTEPAEIARKRIKEAYREN
jgi:tetratricopeptide (TPR) repeat protein